MVYQVGNPAMFDGKRFLPLTGMPMPKMLRNRMLLADCEPEPLTVATWMLKSLMTGFRGASEMSSFVPGVGCAASTPAVPKATSPVAIWRDSLQSQYGKKFILS